MKPGFYLSEKGNFQVWYPRGFFIDDLTTLDVIFSDGTEKRVSYNDEQIRKIQLAFSFEFIGDL